MARETIEEAELLFNHSKFLAAINRIYYGMYHSLCALAIRHGFETSRHGQLIGWFNKSFVKTKQIDDHFSRIIVRAFDKRMDSDYADIPEFSRDEVSTMLKDSTRFIAMIEHLISEKSKP